MGGASIEIHRLHPYRRPLPRPRPRPRPMGATGFGADAVFLVSSTSKASKFKLSGKSQALTVDPRTDKVA